MAKQRVTYHSSRQGSAKHNDREFDTSKAEHIDPSRIMDNLEMTWLSIRDNKTDLSTFEEAEELFYEQHFRSSLNARNERYQHQRHPERIKDMHGYMQQKQSCPEETIYQVGTVKDHIEPKTLVSVYGEFLTWREQAYPQVAFLDMAVHLDESTPHIHERCVWIGHDADGSETVGQNKALQEMGIKRPDLSKPVSKYNNAKMTYTADCREHFQEICREHGINLEITPRQRSKSGLSLIEYKAQQEDKKIAEKNRELECLEAQCEVISAKSNEAEKLYREAHKELSEAETLKLFYSEKEQRMASFMDNIMPFNDRNITLLDLFIQQEKDQLEKAISDIQEGPEKTVIPVDIDIDESR